RDRDVRDAEQPSERRNVADQRVDLLRSDDRARHDGHARVHGRGYESASPEALELVALRIRLADAFEALGPDTDQFSLTQEAFGVLVAREGRTAFARGFGDERQREDQVGGEHAQVACRMVVDDERGHDRVDRDGAGVVRYEQHAVLCGDVLRTAYLDPEPLLR